MWVCPGTLGLQSNHQKWGRGGYRFHPAPTPYAVRHGIFCVLSGFQLLQRWAEGDRAPQSWATWVFRPHLASPCPCQRQRAYVKPKDSDTTEQQCGQALWEQSPRFAVSLPRIPSPFPGSTSSSMGWAHTRTPGARAGDRHAVVYLFAYQGEPGQWPTSQGDP